MRHVRAVSITVAAITVAAVAAITAAPQALAGGAAASPVPAAPSCRATVTELDLYRRSSELTMPSTLTILDQAVPLNLATFTLADRPFKDPSRMLWFRSLLWLAVAAADHAERGDTATAALLTQQFRRAATALPDPGSATPEALAEANRIGWDEGTVFRRTQALLCLAETTGVAPIRELLTSHADALLDPARYAGPPNRAPHNHGMFANLVLLEVADALGEPRYRDVAVSRLANDYATVFSPDGWSREGSSAYLSVNIGGWRSAQQVLAGRGLTDAATALAATLDHAVTMAAHMISPTGAPAMIGNARPDDAVLRPGPAGRPLLLADHTAGVFTARWSWSSADTTWWTAQNRRVRGSHGHQDATALTWQTAGVPVLVDVGQPTYDLDPATVWSRGPEAHNRSVPVRPGTSAGRRHTSTVRRTGRVDTLRLVTNDLGPRQTRRAVIDDARRSLVVTDRTTGAQVQHWHLSPNWRPAGSGPRWLRFRGPGGRRLLLQAAGGRVRLLPTSTTSGWVATGFGTRRPAPEVTVTGGSVLTTTFRVLPRR